MEKDGRALSYAQGKQRECPNSGHFALGVGFLEMRLIVSCILGLYRCPLWRLGWGKRLLLNSKDSRTQRPLLGP